MYMYTPTNVHNVIFVTYQEHVVVHPGKSCTHTAAESARDLTQSPHSGVETVTLLRAGRRGEREEEGSGWWRRRRWCGQSRGAFG